MSYSKMASNFLWLRIKGMKIDSKKRQRKKCPDNYSGLDETLVSVSISRISRSKFLVSVSENHFTEVSVSSRSRKKAYKKFSSRVSCFQSKISRNSSINSRLVLDFSHFSVQISRLSLVSVSENHFVEVSVSSQSRIQSNLVSVSSRSRKTWSRLTLVDHKSATAAL